MPTFHPSGRWLWATAGSTARAALMAAALCWAISSAGCSAQSPVAGGGAPPLAPPPSASAAVSFCDNPNPGCASASAFSLGSLRALNVFVAWNNVPAGTHAQKLRFLLPNGNVYQALETSFEVTQQPAGSFTTVQALPVAGSFITRRSLTGPWQVEVSLDGQTMAAPVVQFNP